MAFTTGGERGDRSVKRNVAMNSHGLTLLELMVAIAILAIVSSFAVLGYNGYIDTAKTSAAKAQIRELSILLTDYALDRGVYPDSLADINNAGLLDPWGNPYQYLKFPDRLTASSGQNGLPGYALQGFSGEHEEGYGDRGEYPDGSDYPEGGEYPDGGDDPGGDDKPANMGDVRKDRNLVPINSFFDLYSMGKDGQSRPPLTAPVSQDDVIYANDGAFIGLAEDY
jgi:general secretion pathway protein G